MIGSKQAWPALTLAAVLLAGAALADPMGDMPGMQQGGMMMVGPMPSVYAGEADKPGAPVFQGLGDHKHPISTKNPRPRSPSTRAKS
jgi:hypothetical protein